MARQVQTALPVFPPGTTSAGEKAGLEIEQQAQGQGAFAGKFAVKRQRIEPVILVGDVQQGHAHLPTPLEKTVSGPDMVLPAGSQADARPVVQP